MAEGVRSLDRDAQGMLRTLRGAEHVDDGLDGTQVLHALRDDDIVADDE